MGDGDSGESTKEPHGSASIMPLTAAALALEAASRDFMRHARRLELVSADAYLQRHSLDDAQSTICDVVVCLGDASHACDVAARAARGAR
jgi:hypothetical protein